MPILDGIERIAIWGFGREGHAALAFLSKVRPGVPVTVLNDTPLADPPDVPVIQGPQAAEAVAAGRFDLVVKSPGIPLRRPEIAAAKEKGVRFTSATDLWFEQNPGAKVVAVTGTKGKSTTVRMIDYLLTQAGMDAKLYGNVGIAMLGQPAGRDATVLELSSYQIADLQFAPTVAVITSLYPEHAPWHGSHENYYRDKLRILDIGATQGVCNAANARLRTRLAGHANLVWYNVGTGFAADGESLTYAGTPVPSLRFALKGEHNYSNLAAACTAASLMGVKGLENGVDFSAFKQLPHRLEEFSARGIVCVNDSLSTVPEAAMAALKTYAGRPTVLILGGTDRGQDYGELIAFLARTKVKCVILVPATGARILKEMQTAPRPYEIVAAPDLAAAVAEGFKRLKPGDVFLLSPASPSFGEFRDYVDRGDRFKALCRTEGS
jgi:UDP-N-acetylmuramoylalanine--D-glutamate ligase